MDESRYFYDKGSREKDSDMKGKDKKPKDFTQFAGILKGPVDLSSRRSFQPTPK
jgi:hypothetical protein